MDIWGAGGWGIILLTAQQQKTLEFIRDYMTQHQQAPTEAEIAAGIGIVSRGVVHRYVHAIEKAGYIKTVPGRRRNIRLRHDYKNHILGLPLMGSLAQGAAIKPILDQDVFNITHALLKPHRFLLQIADDSLANCGILKNDFVVLELQNHARNGEIIVAIIEEKIAALRTFHVNDANTITLSKPYNQQDPEIFTTQQVKVYGLYKGLFRAGV